MKQKRSCRATAEGAGDLTRPLSASSPFGSAESLGSPISSLDCLAAIARDLWTEVSVDLRRGRPGALAKADPEGQKLVVGHLVPRPGLEPCLQGVA